MLLPISRRMDSSRDSNWLVDFGEIPPAEKGSYGGDQSPEEQKQLRDQQRFTNRQEQFHRVLIVVRFIHGVRSD